jgi:hypothetical protein
MHRKTWVGFLSLAVLIPLSFAACGKGCKQKALDKEEMGVLELLPSESNLVLGLDFKKFETTPLGAKMKSGLPAEVLPFLEGVEGMTMGMNLQGMGKEPEKFVAIISGKIDPVKFIAKMKEDAAKNNLTVTEENYEGVTILSVPNDPSVGIAFVSGKALLGKNESVKGAIDLSKNKGDSILKNRDMMDRIHALGTHKTLWAVGIIPEGAATSGAPGGPGNPMGALSGVKAVDLGVDITKELNLDLGVNARSPEDAQQMMTMANSYKTLFGTSLAQKDPMVGKVFEGIQIKVEGDRLTVNLKLDETVMAEITKRAEEKAPVMEEASPPVSPPASPAAATGSVNL